MSIQARLKPPIDFAKKRQNRLILDTFTVQDLKHWKSRESILTEFAPKYPPFAALYIAEDFTTAFKEKSGNYVGGKAPCASLDIEDLTLSKKESHAWVRLNILLTNVLDVRESESLEDFAILLQKIKMPRHLRQKAIMLKLKPPGVVDSAEKLSKARHDPAWRNTPTRVDVASNSQIFGSIAKAAGIQAILYSSRFTRKACLAILPEMLADTEDFVEVIDPPPSLLFSRLDSVDYQKANQNPQSLRRSKECF